MKALFGFQLIFTLIFLSFVNKLWVRFSISQWIITKGLVRYLHPTDDQLRESLGLAKNTNKSNKSRKESRDQKDSKDNTFNVPRNICLTLTAQPLEGIDVTQLPYYAEIHWLLNFTFYAIIIYTFTEFYYFLFPNNNEYNLSLIWCSFVVAFSLKILFSITRLYFKGGDESIGERSLCIVSGSLFFLTAMIVLIADEEFLEFGLVPAYKSFNESAFKLLEAHAITDSASGPTSLLMVKFFLSIWCAIIGAFFTFPGIRVAKMHFDAITYAAGNHTLLVLLHLNFISPLFLILFWIKPIARNYLTVRPLSSSGTALMSFDSFETTRIVSIVVVMALRLCLIRPYLQSYLNIAPQKLTLMKRETGRITNVDLQKLIARVFYYLCVVSLQYITPLLICLFMALIWKTLGNYSWSSYVWTPTTTASAMPLADTISPELTLALFKDVFNPIVMRGLLGFMVWWLCSVWFTTSAIGFVYHSYFS